MFKKAFIITLGAISFSSFAVAAASPYAGQQERKIKALSAKEINGLLTGKGMGLAKAGELNHYPGPKHVLELIGKLGLSKEQIKETVNLYSEMKKQAIPLGERIVKREQQLDSLFSSQVISSTSLRKVLQEIGSLRAELRYVHLNTHLKQKALLSEKQLRLYDQLRGYTGKNGHHGGHEHGHH